MKNQSLIVLVLIFVFTVSGCAGNPAGNSTPTSPAAPTEPRAEEDTDSLIADLQAEGATTETGDSITQDFFNTEGQFITINGKEGVQVFEYESAEAMESDASQVAPDGGSIGTSMVNWVDTPHFYKSGRIIVLYIGNDETTLNLLEKVMGKQFAGR